MIVLTGPESTGKSTLAQALAAHYQVPYVPEMARTYLQTGRAYGPADLLNIMDLQMDAEGAARLAGSAIIADTDLQVLSIWWQEKYGPLPRRLAQAYAGQCGRHYLLCVPDIPWQPDPLRENPKDRARLFRLYETDLQRRGLAYTKIFGLQQRRLRICIETIDALGAFKSA